MSEMEGKLDHGPRGRSRLRRWARGFSFAALLRETGAAIQSLGIAVVAAAARPFSSKRTSGATRPTLLLGDTTTRVNDDDRRSLVYALFIWHVKLSICIAAICISLFLSIVLFVLLVFPMVPTNRLLMVVLMAVVALVLLFVVWRRLPSSRSAEDHEV
ncbi:hypothetical protein HPB50_004843 [Hyalomma asiaticum]|uniref:Uncharacterized protein n=1 Tax=Hyalomma asiaticum TaxID=266040 RepID=A0ACB7SC88_HYAAI|nr:hypothetical protein HPB50_004843 [Hyalomma asiaticum]